MTWRKKSDGTMPVVVQSIHNRRTKYHPIKSPDGFPLSLDKKTFDKLHSRKPKTEQELLLWNIIQMSVKETMRQFMQVGEEEEPQQDRVPRHSKKLITYIIAQKIKQLELDGSSHSTVQMYITAKNCFLDFYSYLQKLDRKYVTMPFTYDLFDNIMVDKYKNWMLGVKKRSTTTISINLRCLRAAITHTGSEPSFTKKILPKTMVRKMALTKDDIVKIKAYKCTNKRMEWARDMFLFSYINGGMNTKDIAMLRWSDMQKDRFHFSRSKRTGSEPVIIVHPLNDVTQGIIDKWGNKDSAFVFGVMDGSEDASWIRKKSNQFTKNINKWLGKLSEEKSLKLSVDKLTTYVARHSFATVLKREGVDIDYISEMMGDSVKTVKKHYFEGFELESFKKVHNSLY